jgi:hypothetical protein
LLSHRDWAPLIGAGATGLSGAGGLDVRETAEPCLFRFEPAILRVFWSKLNVAQHSAGYIRMSARVSFGPA